MLYTQLHNTSQTQFLMQNVLTSQEGEVLKRNHILIFILNTSNNGAINSFPENVFVKFCFCNIFKNYKEKKNSHDCVFCQGFLKFPTMGSFLFILNQTLSGLNSCLIAVKQTANIYLNVKPEYHFQSVGCIQHPDCQRQSIKIKESL